MANRFILNERSYHGKGAIQEIAGEVTSRGLKKALLCTDPDLLKFGVTKKVTDVLDAAGLAYQVYSEIKPNPTIENVKDGVEAAKAAQADYIIAIGGGSSMDTAKAIAVEATHPGTAWDYNCHTAGPTEQTLPILAISTTAGTGSQTTPCAVITKTSAKDKSAIWNKNIFPRAAIVDPEVTLSLPASVTAQTGFDAFCHNFEAYLSVNTNPLVERMALDAIRIIAAYLPRALADGSDLEARSQMAWADTLGGLTNASAGVTLPHGLGMQIGGHCPHVTHGQSLAVFYPAFTRYTYPAAEHKFATVGRIFEPSLERESDAVAAERSCDAIDCFLKRIGLWINFRELNVTKEDIREIADCGQVLGDYANNPRVATIPEMYELLMSCYDRK